jgi:hypothetical protein
MPKSEQERREGIDRRSGADGLSDVDGLGKARCIVFRIGIFSDEWDQGGGVLRCSSKV